MMLRLRCIIEAMKRLLGLNGVLGRYDVQSVELGML